MTRSASATARSLKVRTIVAAGLALALATQQPATPQIRQEVIRQHLFYLADDALEGRGIGTRGHRLAARYVAEKFEALKLEPAGDNKTYLQTMTIREAELTDERVTLSVNGAAEILTFGKDFVASGDPLNSQVDVSGPVVFAGFGLTHPELKHDDYAGVNARGKFVVVRSGIPDSFPSDYRAFLEWTEIKKENAAAHGAIGMITVRSEEAERRAPWSTDRTRRMRTRTTWYDGRNAFDTVPELRFVATASRSAALKMSRAGASLSVRMKTRHNDVESPNVAGLLPGSDPLLRNEYLVYTAHLDHLGIGRAVGGDSIYNGALDNAVSVAMLLEIAGAFATARERPRRSILFVTTTAEEEGLIGADYFVHHPPVPVENLAANINMDGTLAYFPLRDYVALGGERSTLGPIFNRAAGELGIEVSPDPMPEEQFFLRSDHFQFVLNGIPAMFPIEGLKTTDPSINSDRIARQWLAQTYHTPKDDLSQPLNFESIRKQAQLFYLFGYHVANDSQRPKWNDGDFFGKLQKIRPKGF